MDTCLALKGDAPEESPRGSSGAELEGVHPPCERTCPRARLSDTTAAFLAESAVEDRGDHGRPRGRRAAPVVEPRAGESPAARSPEYWARFRWT